MTIFGSTVQTSVKIYDNTNENMLVPCIQTRLNKYDTLTIYSYNDQHICLDQIYHAMDFF